MAEVKEIKPKDLGRILQVLPRTLQLPTKKIDHDAEADVLYLSFDRRPIARCGTMASLSIGAAGKSSV